MAKRSAGLTIAATLVSSSSQIQLYFRLCRIVAPILVVVLSLLLPLSHCFAASSSSTPPSPPLTMPPVSSTTKSPLFVVSPEELQLAQQAKDYIDASSDPFHAVQTSIDVLTRTGFVELSDDDAYAHQLVPGGKYYFTRHKSTLVAFTIGEALDVKVPPCFTIIGGHTDSPNLRVKPRSKRSGSGGGPSGCLQLGVETYGGGLWHTWFDRDLGLSGRVFVQTQTDDNSNKKKQMIEQRLIQIDRALLRISNLAIHLQSAKEREAFAFNKEDHLSPILAMQVKKALEGNKNSGGSEEEEEDKKDTTKPTEDGWTEYQEPALLHVLASELNVDVKDIVDFELCLFDIAKATLGGVSNEFLHSARLDNLASCFMAVQALQNHARTKLANDTDIAMIVLYDHEEVGSASAVGAASPIMSDAIRRITAALYQDDGTGSTKNAADVYQAAIAKSFCLSSDQAHAVHPNYASKHEANHQPKMNQGMVIKRNSNQRYATTGVTGLIMRQIAKKANLPPLQEFMVRQDCGCGSTIGPLISTATGIRAIDMGCPQLSMHSIRETMGVCDLKNGVDLFEAYLEHFSTVDASIQK